MDNNTVAENTAVQVTSDYSQFSFLEANRKEYRGHIEAIKKSLNEVGNFTSHQPILVNDDMKIVDGQHRFIALKEMNLPIHYMVVSGLGINEARAMNILHRSWTTLDYAQSYAKAGDPSYQKFLKLLDDYGFTIGTTIKYVKGDIKGIWAAFRTGEFVMVDEAGARQRLGRLAEVLEFTPFKKDVVFEKAFLQAMRSENYDHKRMVSKVKLFGGNMSRLSSVIEAERQIEDVYNFKAREGARVRLY